ncbi:MAG TPA: hypothetical protein VNA24_08355 [Hyalangium sp.]|jgi:hypothetical protein|nr:hypothetical protein [Hyalangium sp.]
MKKRLILPVALALTASGCTLMGVQPTPPPGGQCTSLSPPPSLPAAQIITKTGVVPPIPTSKFIIASTCEATGTYVAVGVDTQAGNFTFMFKGGAGSRAMTFAKLYEAGVPVTVYTGNVTLKGAVTTNFDPCATTGAAPPGIGDDPRDPPVPPGIAELSWCTANSLAGTQ